jgi:predicted RNase H-like nuclease (RuvC/YqgF family)
VAGPSLTQRVEELTKQVHELEKAFERYRAVTELALTNLEKQLADKKAAEDQHQARVNELQQKLHEQTAKNASLDEKTRHLEKLSDRTWQVWLALLVAFLGLLVAYLKK